MIRGGFNILKVLKFWCSYILQSRILNRRFIHAIGDSHTRSFAERRNVLVHHIGPATAYNLGNIGSTTGSNKKLFNILNRINKKCDTILLIFGEIDCRIHIYYQYIKQNKKASIEQLIDKTILNYGQVIERINRMKLDFFIYGVPPAARQGNIYGYDYYASPQERCKINKLFNKKLKLFCLQKGYRYIDIYSRTSDEKGFINQKYAKDDVHLNNQALVFVEKDLNEYNISL